jgi:GT2 family glycosyltransferase
MPSVSVIVATYNGRNHLDAFFESLAAALPDRAEVIVVDDCSTEPVLEAVPELPRAEKVIRLRNESNLGHAGTLNRGLEAATGDVLVQLNSDLVLDVECISAMVEAIEREGSRLGIVGSRLLYPTTGRTQTVGLAFGLHSKRHVFRHLPADHALCRRSREAQALSGSTVAMTKRVFDLLGPLDEEQYNHNLDLDHCLRALEQGLRNYMCASSVAYHWRNRSGPIRYARVEAAEAAFWAKWGGRYGVDLGTFFDEALDHLLSEFPQLEEAPFTILDLTRSADQEIATRHLEARWEGVTGAIRSFRQMNNDSDRLWLSLLVPHWLVHEPRPFIYLVDSHVELEENAMWFAHRRSVVREEVIVDLSASACTTSEFFDWQAGATEEFSVEHVVDIVDS